MPDKRDFSRSGQILSREDAKAYLKIMNKYFPNRTVLSMVDRGTWLRRIIKVILDGDDIAYIKIDQDHDGDGWLTATDGECHERDVDRILSERGLHVIPRVLIVDTTCALLPHPYIIQAHKGGTRLEVLLQNASPGDAQEIFRAVGRFYRRLHNITNDQAGVWIGSTPDKPLGNPTGYMYNAEIVNGSGSQALARDIISQQTYDRAVGAWRDDMEYLLDFQPALVHYSPFLWNIYLEHREQGWSVCKIMSVGDVMWWEPAYDLACLCYPPFGTYNPAHWEAFVEEYGPLPARKRILLYTVLQTLCAMMGSYWELEKGSTRNWLDTANTHLVAVLEEIEDNGLSIG